MDRRLSMTTSVGYRIPVSQARLKLRSESATDSTRNWSIWACWQISINSVCTCMYKVCTGMYQVWMSTYMNITSGAWQEVLSEFPHSTITSLLGSDTGGKPWRRELHEILKSSVQRGIEWYIPGTYTYKPGTTPVCTRDKRCRAHYLPCYGTVPL